MVGFPPGYGGKLPIDFGPEAVFDHDALADLLLSDPEILLLEPEPLLADRTRCH